MTLSLEEGSKKTTSASKVLPSAAVRRVSTSTGPARQLCGGGRAVHQRNWGSAPWSGGAPNQVHFGGAGAHSSKRSQRRSRNSHAAGGLPRERFSDLGSAVGKSRLLYEGLRGRAFLTAYNSANDGGRLRMVEGLGKGAGLALLAVPMVEAFTFTQAQFQRFVQLPRP